MMLKEMEDQKSAFRSIALNEARQAMSTESKKIVAENMRLHEELKFHHAMTIELQAEKAEVEGKLKTVKRDLEVLNDKDLEYARQSFVKTKEIKLLRDRSVLFACFSNICYESLQGRSAREGTSC